MTLAPGISLGVYEIVALVGRGGMGELYRARDTKRDPHPHELYLAMTSRPSPMVSCR